MLPRPSYPGPEAEDPAPRRRLKPRRCSHAAVPRRRRPEQGESLLAPPHAVALSASAILSWIGHTEHNLASRKSGRPFAPDAPNVLNPRLRLTPKSDPRPKLIYLDVIGTSATAL